MKRSCVVLVLAGALLWLLVSAAQIVNFVLAPAIPGPGERAPDIVTPVGKVIVEMPEQEIRDIAYRRYQADAAKLTH